MKKRENPNVYIGVMVLALIILGLSLTMETFASRLLPLTISGLVFILAAVGIGWEILKREAA